MHIIIITAATEVIDKNYEDNLETVLPFMCKEFYLLLQNRMSYNLLSGAYPNIFSI